MADSATINELAKINSLFTDVLTSNPNSMGEALRHWSFVNPFCSDELKSGFLKLELVPNEIKDIMDIYSETVYAFEHYKSNIRVYWYYDGDQVMLFDFIGKKVLNDDAKKEHNWKFI